MDEEAASIRAAARPLSSETDLDPLLERIGDARYVLIGEASHGTHEFYAWRAALSRRLIEEKGFSFVAVEGDWPDCYAVQRSVTCAQEAPEDPREALRGFDRWPTWMWANDEVADFARWLRNGNAAREPDRRVGFYGLDVYSLWESLRAALEYLEEHHPQHVGAAHEAFRCLEPYAEDPQSYARAAQWVPDGCEPEVLRLLAELRSSIADDGGGDRSSRFNAEQNARSAAGAEAYYRVMVKGGPDSWNVRDRHMVETLEELMKHHGPDARAIVWEHNTHIGDARWTDMADAGMVNVGQLVREAHAPEDVVLVGFGTHSGHVLAASRWGAPVRSMTLPAARKGSVERLLHNVLGAGSSALFVFDGGEAEWAADFRGHRAIGVVYHPHAERWGNYVPTVLNRRYDAFLWLDETTALAPLQEPSKTGADRSGELETWPSGT
ncbi:erythromycin esterase family protein [uncultured Arthrobacter sp.]|uniref:erythromycin esterase family protein n=1 Tax=uncultured Arthrobacter sp. TaxID=114050 RepID=UPI0025E6448E|nr:erythromycin esterase family protein [uncultured Arthrobacter sp.]